MNDLKNKENEVILKTKREQLNEIEDQHQEKLNKYKTQIKHYLYENQNQLALGKVTLGKELQQFQSRQKHKEEDIELGRNNFEAEIREIENSHEEFLISLRRDHDSNMGKIREEYLQRTLEATKYMENNIQYAQNEIELKEEAEKKKLEENKDIQVKIMMDKHEKVRRPLLSQCNLLLTC